MATKEVMQKQKQYADLIQPLRIESGPAGVYPEPRVWMYGKDLPGFNAHFTYGFFDAPRYAIPRRERWCIPMMNV